MQDGNHLIARVADSHMPTRIMESEVRRFSRVLRGFFLYETDLDYLRTDRNDGMGPRTNVDSCA